LSGEIINCSVLGFVCVDVCGWFVDVCVCVNVYMYAQGYLWTVRKGTFTSKNLKFLTYHFLSILFPIFIPSPHPTHIGIEMFFKFRRTKNNSAHLSVCVCACLCNINTMLTGNKIMKIVLRLEYL